MLLVALDLVFTSEIYRDKNADDPFCCFFFFLPFLSGVKKKKKRRIKLEKLRTRARSVTIRFVTLDEGKQGGLLSFMGYGSPADL